MVYVVKRIKGRRYVYQQFKIGNRTISKYIGNFDKIIEFYLNYSKNYGKMRPPGFEPGSSAWQAGVLDQARLRPRYIDIMLPRSYNFFYSFFRSTY